MNINPPKPQPLFLGIDTGGTYTDDTKFITSCAQLIEQGTGYVKPRRIAINVLTTDSRMVRLLIPPA